MYIFICFIFDKNYSHMGYKDFLVYLNNPVLIIVKLLNLVLIMFRENLNI